MTALIPFSLTECLAPREVGELLKLAEREHSKPEELIVMAIREYLATRQPQPEAPESPAMPA